MNAHFIRLFSESIRISYYAAIAIAVILCVRWILQKIHISYHILCFLWLIPFARLVIPFQIESDFSMMPKETAEPSEIVAAWIHTSGVEAGESAASYAETVVQNSVNQMSDIILFGLAVICLAGIFVFLFYGVISAWRLKKRLVFRIHQSENIYEADDIPSAFVVGFFQPDIYIPSNMEEKMKPYVILHEKMHIKRKDHMVKIIAYFICSLYWYQPMVWILYHFLCKDLELACDEAVMDEIGWKNKKVYAEALLELSVFTKKMGPLPLTFAETNPKKRIREIMSYKKAKSWMYAVCMAVIFLCGARLLTNPKDTFDERRAVEDGENIPSYHIEHKESIQIINEKPDGKRKTTYFVFEADDRTMAHVSVMQNYKDLDNINGLLADDIEKTHITLQKMEGSSWIQASGTYVSWEERGTLELDTDENGEVMDEAAYCDYIDGGCGTYYMLDAGTYRYVIETGFPKAEVTHKVEQFEPPALTKETAIELPEEKELKSWFEGFGIFTMNEESSHWYKIHLDEKRNMEIDITEWYATVECTRAVVRLYDETGNVYWKYNLWESENRDFGAYDVITMEAGDYYIELEPKEINYGVNYSILLRPYEWD